MELGDFEPVNEFEFDLSDVDVAAFESVATEDTANALNQNQQQQQEQQQEQQQQEQQQQQQQQQQHEQQEQQSQPPPQPQPQPQTQQHPPQQPPPSNNFDKQAHQQVQHHHHHHHHHVKQNSSTPNAPAGGKILLVPINSKPGTPGYKHLFQLPAGATPITMSALTSASGNKKQIIQLAPLHPSSFNNLSKSNYTFPVNAPITTTSTATTTSQLLPGSSQSQHKQHQLYIGTSKSPIKHQQASTLNSVLNKSLNNLQNNTSVSSNFSTSANLSTTRNNSHNDSLRASTPNSIVANEVPKRKPCNCTKSQCLKLYCDCFANGEFCSGCNCTNCFNSLSKEKERQKAISQCLERNPEAFRPKIGKANKSMIGEAAPSSIERRHTKGCNCKRSGCLKNYCECYEAKILCSNLCKCCGCKNYEESFERKSLMQLANSTSDNARGILKNLLPTNNNSNTGKEFTKCFITDKVIHASLMCLLQSAQQAEKDGVMADGIPNLIQTEMGKCFRMIVDSATETTNTKKR